MATPSPPLPHKDRLLAEKGRFIHLIESQDEQGTPFYLYLQTTFLEARELSDAIIARRSAQFTDFGEVLASGYGTVPPRVALLMWLRYGFRPQASSYGEALSQYSSGKSLPKNLN